MDLILENGVRLQVKTVEKLDKMGYAMPSFGKGNSKKSVKISEYADYAVVWIRQTGDFFIIPARLLDFKTTISLMANDSKYGQFKNNWNLLERG